MKRTCKKLLSVLLAVAMVISLMPALILTASAENEAVITVGTLAAVPGEEVTVPVSITDNAGFATIIITPTYDASKLTLTSVEKGSLLTSPSGGLTVGTSIAYDSIENTTGDGVIFNLNFAVSASAAAGAYSISLALANGDTGNFCNITPEEVPVTFVAGGITVNAAASDAVTPTFTTDLSTAEISYLPDAAADALTVLAAVTDTGEISYQWYSNTVNSTADGTPVGTGTSYTPSTSAEGTTYYYVVATNKLGDSTATATSSVATVTVGTASTNVTGGTTITTGGTYNIASDASGVITIDTTEAVTLVGNGMSGTAYSGLTIDCTVAGADLTIDNVYISAPVTNKNVLNFTGTGNDLTLKGDSLLENSGASMYYAAIHVPSDGSLTIDGDGTLYVYKSALGACIGGDCDTLTHVGETNGDITIAGGTIFAKGTMTGATIGAGQKGTGGKVYITGGVLNLMTKARGAVIGGGGENGGVHGAGGDVYISGGTLLLYTDWTGSQVGCGNGNTIYDDGGNLYVSGGSVKTVITANAGSKWDTSKTEDTVSDAAITAVKMNNETDQDSVYLLKFDASLLSAASGTYTVDVDGTEFYSGTGHEWNAGIPSSTVNGGAFTADTTDTNLYLYLTGESHILTVNGENFSIIWDPDASSFVVETSPESGWDGTANISWYDSSNPQASYTLTTAKQLAGLASLVNAGNDFANVAIILGNDITLNTDGSTTNWKPIGTVTITIDGNKCAVVGEGMPFAGTLDGAGYGINGLYIDSTADIQGLFGYLTGTVKDLNVSGSITSSAASAEKPVGGIAAFNYGGTIEDVINNVTVNAPNMYYVGGIAGYNLEGTITRCANLADITGVQEVGGIAGRNGGTITYSYNAGKVDGINASSKNGVGGIAGKNGNHYTAVEYGIIDSCYNSGTVGRSGQKWVGGIAGFQNGRSSTTNCYNSGTIIVGAGRYAAIIGQEEGASSNNYSLDTQPNDTNQTVIGTQLSQADLKAAAPLMAGAFVSDTVGGGYPVLFWQASLNLQTITVDSAIENGTVTVPAQVAEGNTVTVTVTPDESYNLTADSLTYTVAGQEPVVITATDGVYSFVMPAADITITASFTGGAVWTGSGTQTDPYTITTADGMVALATFTNEGETTRDVYWQLANNIDLSTVCSESLGSWTPIGNLKISGSDEVTGYSFLGDFEGNGYSIQNLYVISEAGYLGLFGGIGGNDNHDGTAGYGVVRNFTLSGTVINTFQGSNRDDFADFVGGVCGRLYAGGTISDVINHATILAPCVFNVGGIAGFAGTCVLIGGNESSARYTNNPSGSNTHILRCGNEAMVIGYNKVGGIVGQNAAQVMYCYNKGWIIPHLSGSGGGTGGIAGRNGNNNVAYEEGKIAYCYNSGKVTDNGYSWTWNDGAGNADNSWKRNSDTKWIGGICGFCNNKSIIRNCYASEFFTTLDNNYTNMKNPIVGHLDNDNALNQVISAYCLDTLWYNPNAYDAERGTPMTQAQLQAATYGSGDILTLLGTAYTADATSINGGYPVLRWQVGASVPTLTSIGIEAAPDKVIYDASEVFDPTGMVVLAIYSDGSKSIVKDYTYSTEPLTAGTTGIDITYGGITVTQAIAVSMLGLSGIAITTNPTNLLYASDETFDPAGMVVTATYNENTATNKEVVYDETGAAGYTYSVDSAGLLTVSYTEGGVTKTAPLQLTYLAGDAPTATAGVYQLDSADDMLWFANQVNALGRVNLNAELLAGVDLSSIAWTPIGMRDTVYCGEFDGNDFTVTFNNAFTASYAGIFGYVGTATDGEVSYTASIHDLTAAGSITAAEANKNNYIAGIAGYVSGPATFTDCTNQASISAGGYVGGIAGYVSSGSSLTDCENTGAVTATNTYSGGMAGFASDTTFTNCTNSADIAGATSTAGIAGYISGNSSVTNCINNGIIAGSTTVAGICANLYGTALEIQNCANTGGVTALGGAVGGIAGKGYGTIDGSYNTGALQGTFYIGGIVGQNYSAAVSNCYNTGAVEGTSGTAVYRAAGGICGLGGTGSFTNCYNSGEVTSNYAGALVGASNNTEFTLTNCYYVTGTASIAFNERTAGKVVVNGIYDVTAAELHGKAVDLGEAYKAGLVSPILTWQPNEISEIGTSSRYEATITSSALAALANAGKLVIHTDFGDITLDADAIANLIANAGGGDVTLTVEAKAASELPEAQQGAAANADMLLEISLTSGGSPIAFNNGTNGTMTIEVPFTPSSPDIDVTVYYIDETGTRTAMTSSCADGKVTFATTHLSLYAIEEEKSAYTVNLTTANTDRNVGETITAWLNVSGAADYASLQTTVSYDKTKVSYTDNALTGFTVTDNAAAGTLTISRFGSTTSTGLQGYLTFTVNPDISTGSSEAAFSVASAVVGVRGDPSDAAAAGTGTDISVDVHNLTVTFEAGDHVTMATATAYVKYGVAGLYTTNAYETTFTYPNPSADTGCTLDAPMWTDGTDRTSFGIISETVFTANAVYTATATVDVYDIVYELDGGTNDTSNPATYSYGDSFTLADPAKENCTFVGWYADDSFTTPVTGISATDTGDKTFYARWQGEVTITLPSQVTVVSGVTDGKANYGTDVVFTVTADPGYTLESVSYTVGTGSAVTLTVSGGQYTIPGTALTDDVTVTVTQHVTGSVTFITFEDYKGAPMGFKVLLLEATVPEGYKYQYDGTDLFKSDKYAKYACFVPADVDAETALYTIACVAGTAPVINYDGNVNQSPDGAVTSADAQLIYDLYTGLIKYVSDSDFSKVSEKMRLAADINGDGTVDTADAQIVVNSIHNIV